MSYCNPYKTGWYNLIYSKQPAFVLQLGGNPPADAGLVVFFETWKLQVITVTQVQLLQSSWVISQFTSGWYNMQD